MNPENETIEEENDYIKTIQDLKANTVSKDQYEKLKKENKQLLDTLVSGGTIEQPKEKVDVDRLRRELNNGNISNLEYCKTALELRDAIIEEGGRDPFLPFGTHVNPEDSDYASAEKVAQVLKECIDYADGDSSIFTMELQRKMIDAMPRR